MPSNEDFNDDALINKNGRLYKGLQTDDVDISSANIVTPTSVLPFLLVCILFRTVYVMQIPRLSSTASAATTTAYNYNGGGTAS